MKGFVRPPLSIPEGAVMVGNSLWVFPDPELARRVLEEDADPQLYGGRCVYYGYPLAARTGTERIWQQLRHQAERLRLSRYRVRYPVRLVGTAVALWSVGYGALIWEGAFVMAGLVLLGLVAAHYHLTRRGA